MFFSWTLHFKEKRKAIASELELNKEEAAQSIIKKDTSIKELDKIKDVQAGQLTEIQASVQDLQTSLTSEAERLGDIFNTLYRPVH